MTPRHVRNVLDLMAKCQRADEMTGTAEARRALIERQHDDMIDFARAALAQAEEKGKQP